MNSSNVCQECNKTYAKAPKRCMCGWYFVRKEAQKHDPSLCQYFYPNDKQCPELGTVDFRTKGNSWYCGEHARELREKSYKR